MDGLADGLAALLGANIQSDQGVELEIWRKGGPPARKWLPNTRQVVEERLVLVVSLVMV